MQQHSLNGHHSHDSHHDDDESSDDDDDLMGMSPDPPSALLMAMQQQQQHAAAFGLNSYQHAFRQAAPITPMHSWAPVPQANPINGV
jgi:hypothetical protein